MFQARHPDVSFEPEIRWRVKSPTALVSTAGPKQAPAWYGLRIAWRSVYVHVRVHMQAYEDNNKYFKWAHDECYTYTAEQRLLRCQMTVQFTSTCGQRG